MIPFGSIIRHLKGLIKDKSKGTGTEDI